MVRRLFSSENFQFIVIALIILVVIAVQLVEADSTLTTDVQTTVSSHTPAVDFSTTQVQHVQNFSWVNGNSTRVYQR